MSYINPIALLGKEEITFPLREEELQRIGELVRASGLGIASSKVDQEELASILFRMQIPSYQRLYDRLWRDRPLHRFLASAQSAIISKVDLETSKLQASYYDFWRPFYLRMYGERVADAYFDKNIAKLNELNGVFIATNGEEQSVVFEPLNLLVKGDHRQIHQFEIEARALELSGDELLRQVKSVVHPAILNGLPKEYTSAKPAFAHRLLELSILVYNEHKDFDTAIALLEMALQLDLDEQERNELALFSNQLAEYIETFQQLKVYEQDIKAHLDKLKRYQSLIGKLANKKLSSGDLTKLMKAGINPTALNRLPKRFHFFAEEYAKALRIFSAHSWNQFEDAEQALHCLETTESMPITAGRQEQLAKDKAALLQKIQQREQERLAHQRKAIDPGRSSTFSPALWRNAVFSSFLLALVLALLGSWHSRDSWWEFESGGGVKQDQSTANRQGNINRGKQGTSGSNVPEKRGVTPLPDSIRFMELPYLHFENRLNTGDSPYDGFYGRGRWNDVARSSILIRNRSDLDVVVCLEDNRTGRTIRNEYIREGDQFRLSNLPEGSYMIKTFYGRNWNPQITHQDGDTDLRGAFVENFFLKKPDGGKAAWEVYDINQAYTSYEVDLKSVHPEQLETLQPVNGGFLSWNLRDFGKTKDTEELKFIAEIMKNFDLVGIQEVVSGPGGAQAVAALADLLNRKGAKWDYAVSLPTRSPAYKTERYAFLWKTSEVRLSGSAWLESSLATKVYREPYLARFIMANDTLLMVNYHARNYREKPSEELRYLFQLPDLYPKDELIIFGDFNLATDAPIFRNLYAEGYRSAPNYLKTTLKTQCREEQYLSQAIDHIFFSSAIEVQPSSGVIDFVGGCEGLPAARRISDHLPVWIQIGEAVQ